MTTVSVNYPLTISATTAADATALTAIDATDFAPGINYVIPGVGVFAYAPSSIAATASGTVIAATPRGNWLLVTQPYLILNSSNEIDSSQTDTTTLFPAGTGALPSVAIRSANLGVYSPAANQLGLSVAGAVALTVTTTALIVAASTQISADAGGTAAAPAYAFTGDLDVGMYRVGANSLGFATNGLIAANFSTTQLNLASGFALAVATVQVVGARNTGWVTMAGTGNKSLGSVNATTITATDPNIQALAAGVKSVIDALILHGLIGA